MTKSRLFPVLHTILFAAFPILFLYAQNADEMKVSDVPAPLLISCGLALALALLVGLVLRNLRKGAVIATATTFFFLSYGQFIRALPDFEYKMAESVLGPNLLVLLLSVVLLVLIVRGVLKARADLLKLTTVLTWLGIALVTLEIVHGGVALAMRKNIASGDEPILEQSEAIERTPDIYYIVVDGYGRSDILKKIYDFDNSEFISELRALGFFVADSSYTNYPQTLLALGSTLNLDYVEKVGDFPRSLTDRVPLEEKLSNNLVMEHLSESGYTTVGFSTAYGLTDLKTVDRRFAPGWSTNEFESMLVSTTPIPLFAASSHSPFARHRRRVSYVLNKLPLLSDIESPKFVFAHIVSPHPPFLFDADGNAVEVDEFWTVADGSHRVKDSAGAEEYKRLYRGQATYISRRLLKTIKEILDNTKDNPPVIIIQADHGPGSGLNWGSWKKSNLRERFGILNAYYMPGLPDSILYHEITPINTFRVVFNQYFGTELELLPDRQEFATWYQPFAFYNITKLLRGSAYANLLRQYSLLPPDSLSIDDLSERVEDGARYYDDRVRVICERGLNVDLKTVQHVSRYEISCDWNDKYEVQFRKNEVVIAVDTVLEQERYGGKICVDTVIVPSAARQRGFNNIMITPFEGDGAYLIGHLVPL